MYKFCWDINLGCLMCMRNVHGYAQVTPKQPPPPCLTRKKSLRAVISRNINQMSSPHKEKGMSKRPKQNVESKGREKRPIPQSITKRDLRSYQFPAPNALSISVSSPARPTSYGQQIYRQMGSRLQALYRQDFVTSVRSSSYGRRPRQPHWGRSTPTRGRSPR